MDNEVATAIREMVKVLEKRADAQDDFQRRVLEELRLLNRTLESMQKRVTVGDL
jgi:hypothetical protein